MSDREQAIKDVAEALRVESTIHVSLFIAEKTADSIGTCDALAYAVSQRERVLRLERALREARAANEMDRTQLNSIVRAIDEEINGRLWLLEGRGCYEWDDDRYRQEFGWAAHAIQEKLEPLRKIAGDLKNCPATQEEVDLARAALEGK